MRIRQGWVGKILLYEQGKDLFTWQYVGVLFESSEYGKVLECRICLSWRYLCADVFSDEGGHRCCHRADG